jgi:hypothetical protein
VEWIQLALDRDRWPDFVNVMPNLRFLSPITVNQLSKLPTWRHRANYLTSEPVNQTINIPNSRPNRMVQDLSWASGSLFSQSKKLMYLIRGSRILVADPFLSQLNPVYIFKSIYQTSILILFSHLFQRLVSRVMH